jgi:hypothetical protein
MRARDKNCNIIADYPHHHDFSWWCIFSDKTHFRIFYQNDLRKKKNFFLTQDTYLSKCFRCLKMNTILCWISISLKQKCYNWVIAFSLWVYLMRGREQLRQTNSQDHMEDSAPLVYGYGVRVGVGKLKTPTPILGHESFDQCSHLI